MTAALDAAFASHDDGIQPFVLALRYHLGTAYYTTPAIKSAFAYTGPPQPDGSWHVVSRLHPPASVSPPYFETGYPYGHDQFVSAMGACWSIMALATALGPAHNVNLPPLPDALRVAEFDDLSSPSPSPSMTCTLCGVPSGVTST